MTAQSIDCTRVLDGRDRVSLCDVLDRVLNTGVVAAGEIVISVADIDLIYLGLQAVLTSIETARPADGVCSPAVRLTGAVKEAANAS